MRDYKIISREAQNILSLEEVKSYLRIASSSDDSMITNMIDAAIIAAENFMRWNLVLKKIECVFIDVSILNLPLVPIAEVMEILVDGLSLEEAKYKILSENIVLDKKYSHVKITYIAGFSDPMAIPAIIKEGLKNHIGFMYDNRGSKDLFSSSIFSLYETYRRVRV
ncbi:MAG UNVERIFIED_CONTAM: head-tail connector protein [Rickettsiaceae bacterium]|jgi:hypothetical protein